MAKKKNRSLLSKAFNNKLMRGLTLYELADIMASPASEVIKLLGMQEGGQIKRTKKKPIGWGKARYGK